jgi:cytosine/adenosine deaminase-related metal-dependent hydrolase
MTPWLLVLWLACDRTPPDKGDTDTPGETDSGGDSDTPAGTDTPGETDTPSDPDVQPLDAVTACGNPVPPVSDGVCAATPGSNGAILLRGTVLTDEGILEDGTVLLDENGDIACVGCDCSSEPTWEDAAVIACPEGVISPGLINPHDHLTFSEGAPIPDAGRRYDHRHDWRGSLSTPSNAHGTGRTSAGNQWVEVRQLLGGATTIVGSGGASGLLRNPDQGGDLLEGADLPTVENETFPLGDSNEAQRSACGDWSWVATEAEVGSMDAFVPHVAEGINDRARFEFLCQSSSLDGARDFTEANAAHVHAMALLGPDIWAMAEHRTTAIWSPRSNISLYGNTLDAATMDTLGVPLALGTDWTYSGSATMLRELACADQWNQERLAGHFSAADLWWMATGAAARAVGAEGKLGVLREGAIGDIAVFDGRARTAHAALIGADSGDVVLVLRGGTPLYGDAGVVAALRNGCDTLDVCGEARRVCLSDEIGTTWSALRAATPGAYPATFCDIPSQEPTCTPVRPGDYDGTATTEDPDGDGLLTTSDNCPSHFNPVRPIDGGAQADADDDGIGDPCDPTPVSDDLDGDGVNNLDDNCPLDANPDQLDAESDGRGDFCDVCDEVANPFGVCPEAAPEAVDIVTVRTTLPDGVAVLVEGVVTAVANDGFGLQDPAVLDGRDAGIWIYTGSRPSVVVGDAAQVIGETDDYFGERQVGADTVTDLGPTTPIAPVAVTLAQAAGDTYEGVLVEITDGEMTNAAYDCSVDGSCSDANLWEIGGATGVLVYDKAYGGSDWAAHIGELPVRGVLTYRWNRRRVVPRGPDDFGP